MKEYVAPKIDVVNLRAEEGIASSIECKIGACHDEAGKPIYLTPSAGS